MMTLLLTRLIIPLLTLTGGYVRPLHNPVFSPCILLFCICIECIFGVVQALEVLPVTLLQCSVYRHSVFRALHKAHCLVTNAMRFDSARSTRLRRAFPPFAWADIYRVHSAVVCIWMALGSLKMSGVYDSAAVSFPTCVHAIVVRLSGLLEFRCSAGLLPAV